MTIEPSAHLPPDALARLTAETPDLLAAHMAANAARRRGALSDSELDQASGGGSPIPRGMEIGTAVIPVVRDRVNGDGFTPYW